MESLRYPLLIDGGLSNQLEKLGCDLNNKLWSADVLLTNPDAVVKTHTAYLDAGADIISTVSYQATLPGFMALGYSRDEATQLILRSVELAKKAVDQFDIPSNRSKPLIAASMGPYGAFLADGSEYKGNYEITKEELTQFHQERIDILDRSEADILAFETIPSLPEAEVLASLLSSTNKAAWVSFSCKDAMHISDGTELKKVASLLKSAENVFAVGINCTAPKHISDLINEFKAADTGKHILVYPNSGEAFNATTKKWLGTSDPQDFGSLAAEWLELGADMIGGCCRIEPHHIQALRVLINERGTRRVLK